MHPPGQVQVAISVLKTITGFRRHVWQANECAQADQQSASVRPALTFNMHAPVAIHWSSLPELDSLPPLSHLVRGSAFSCWMQRWCHRGPCACCRYRAHFRWEHYQHQLAQQMDLPDETEACASVTSAFLQVTSFVVALALAFNCSACPPSCEL